MSTTKRFDFQKEIQKIEVAKIEIESFANYFENLKIDGMRKERIKHYSGSFIVIITLKYEEMFWKVQKCLKEILSFQNSMNQINKKKESKISKSQKPNFLEFKIHVKELIENSIVTPCSVLYNFLEISAYSLFRKCPKYKECKIYKRSGGRYKEGTCSSICKGIFKKWGERWIIISTEGIIYLLNAEIENARETLLFDQSFSVDYGFRMTGRRKGVSITTATRKFMIETVNHFQMLEILKTLQMAAQSSPYVQLNRFVSFAPVRTPTATCKWYINGYKYFEDLCNSLLLAKEEVLITDWWLSPELYLKRPVNEHFNQESRLDRVLAKLADNGVQIRIIVYREVKFALYNDSEHVELALKKLTKNSKNIKVIRHPNNLLFLWSHHEKLVVIDGSIGYMGGLDLCFGRMDYMEHPLIDPYEVNALFPGIDYANNRVCDFKNVRKHQEPLVPRNKCPRMPWRDIALRVEGEPVKDLVRHFVQYWNFANVDLASNDRNENLLEIGRKKKTPESGLTKLRKKIVDKLKTKSHVKDLVNRLGGAIIIQKGPDNMNDYLKAQDNLEDELNIVDYDEIEDTKFPKKNETIDFDGSSHQLNLNKEDKSNQYDLLTMQTKVFTNNYEYPVSNRNSNLNLKEEEKSPKTPLNPDKIKLKVNFQAESIFLKSPKSIDEKNIDKSFHFTKSFHKGEDDEYHNGFKRLVQSSYQNAEISINEMEYFPRLKKTNSLNNNSELKVPKANLKTRILQKLGLNRNKSSENKLPDSFFRENMMNIGLLKQKSVSHGSCRCQLLRSSSRWSIGLHTKSFEMSIQTAYIQVIQSAKYFIYIENQFFISSTAGGAYVKNGIVEALAYKIQEAYSTGTPFKVLVVLPLLPGFEGEVRTSPVLRIQMYWQYMTISRGENSLLNILIKKKINPDNYIKFIGMRNHAVLENVPVTELIYIHSKVFLILIKMMIVDDRIAIIGSANINDRSMCGNRDSEIAMVIEDLNQIESKMNGKAFKAANFAQTLRVECWSNIFALSHEAVQDPLNPILWETIQKIIDTNTMFYREVFGVYPDNSIQKYTEIDELKKASDTSKYEELKGTAQGFAVDWPLNFLMLEDLGFKAFEKENFAPGHSFT